MTITALNSEQQIIDALGAFIKVVYPDIEIFDMGQPDWTSQEGVRIGLKLMSMIKVGSSDSEQWDEDNYRIHYQDYKAVVHIMAFRQSDGGYTPLSLLTALDNQFNDYELITETLKKAGIGFIDSTTPSRVDVVLDGERTELRARMTATFSLRFEEKSPIASNVIEHIYVPQIKINEPTHATNKVTYSLEDIHYPKT